MKKLLACLAMLAFGVSAWAQTKTVPVYWPFSISSIQVTGVRAMLENTNSQQKDINFILDHKPGAGSTIAVRHIVSTPNLELLAVSSSYFMRPVFYPDTSHSADDLKPVAIIASHMPIMVFSKKYKNLTELKKQKQLSIGVNNGSVTQLVALTLKKSLPDTDIVLVPYDSTNKSAMDVMADSLDLAVGFTSDTDQWVKQGTIHVIGITGTRPIKGYPTFASQGLKGFDDLFVEYWIMANQRLTDQQTQELNLLFRKSAAAGESYWAQDSATTAGVENYTVQQVTQRFQQQKAYWRDTKIKLLGN